MRAAALSPVLVAVLLGGCSSFEVTTDYDPKIDFSVFEAYAWLQRPDEEQTEPETLLDQRITRAIDAALAAKGLRQVPADEASLLVTYHVDIREKVRVDTQTYGYSPYAYTPHTSRRRLPTSTSVQHYDEGTLLIDLVDPHEKQLLWRGRTQSRIRYSNSPDEREERIRSAVDAILEDYPPRRPE